MKKKFDFKNGTILVVDDEEDIREILGSFFEKTGAQVLMASNGLEALQILQKSPVDVIISDVCMPEMDGEELLRRIRNSGLTERPFFFISGNIGYSQNTIDEIGARGSFQKPFQFEEIGAAIGEALAKEI